MTADQFRKVLTAQPFQPFTVHLADGRQYFIPHRDFAFLPPNTRMAVVALQDGTMEFVDLFLIVGLETRPQAPAAAEAP
ncbi:MAG: hypothetical protein HY721_06990 [Planctomycetes bacterium]|nr:hypothetical protein [Planctomycetota bacterium]